MQVLFLLAMLFHSPSGSFVSYYLSIDGNDTADGTSHQTAWKTIDRANRQSFNPGDKLLLEGGTTFTGMLVLTAEDEGTPALPVTISSFGAGRATIQNADTSAISVANAGGFVIRNLLLKSPDRTKNRGYGLQFINTRAGADQRRFIRIDSVSASGFGRDGIWLGGAPSDQSQSGFTDVRVTHCLLFDNQYHGLFITGVFDTNAQGYANHDLLIQDCLAYENTGDPLFLTNHSGSGMEIDDVEDALIDRCGAYRNGFLCNARVGGPCGIWLHAANRSVIQQCVAIGNRTGRGLDGAGFDLDGGTTNCRIEHCYARDNDGSGILVWNYEQAPHRLGNNVICHNVLENNGIANDYAAIHIGTSGTPIANMQVYQNTVFSSREPTGRQRAIWVSQNCHVFVLNNLFISNNEAGFIDIPVATTGSEVAGNWFWTTDKRKQRGGKALVNPLVSAVNTHESPSPVTITQLRGYRPLPASPLLGGGARLSAHITSRRIIGFWGQPVSETGVGAGK